MNDRNVVSELPELIPRRRLSGQQRVMLIWLAVSVAEAVILLCVRTRVVLALLWFAEKLFVTVVGMRLLGELRRIEKGVTELTRGNVEYQISRKGMLPPFRQATGEINKIGEGLRRTLEEKVRSERMRAELITNVSHDIKTPITSIISYVDLLNREGLDSPNAPAYLEVLDRQANRLRKLVNDMVDAAKASSGTLPVKREHVDANLIVSQAVGEYTRRLQDQRLNPVLALEKEKVPIYVDPQLLWRVADNLLSNVVKYATPGTRVLFGTRIDDGWAVLLLQNAVARTTDLPIEELTERFVRGDTARSTEGTGLGLSIAKSLIELQGGKLTLSLEGERFGVEVRFPLDK